MPKALVDDRGAAIAPFKECRGNEKPSPLKKAAVRVGKA
jgi:hypothetical protein